MRNVKNGLLLAVLLTLGVSVQATGLSQVKKVQVVDNTSTTVTAHTIITETAITTVSGTGQLAAVLPRF